MCALERMNSRRGKRAGDGKKGRDSRLLASVHYLTPHKPRVDTLIHHPTVSVCLSLRRGAIFSHCRGRLPEAGMVPDRDGTHFAFITVLRRGATGMVAKNEKSGAVLMSAIS